MRECLQGDSPRLQSAFKEKSAVFKCCKLCCATMDLFYDSDESENRDPENDDALSLCNMAFIELMRLKPFTKKKGASDMTNLYRKIAVVGVGVTAITSSLLIEKLEKAQFKDVVKIPDALPMDGGEDGESFAGTCQFDIVVDLGSSPQIQDLVVSGGTYMALCPATHFALSFPIEKWNLEKASRKSVISASNVTGDLEFVVLQRRGFLINTLGAIYWADGKDKHLANNSLGQEYSNLEEVTVALSLAERELGIFSDASHSKAVHSLQSHGLCILPGLFPVDVVMEWGVAAVSDMTEALSTLRGRGIDLLKPGVDGPRIENFHELSMREALRCDLRNGRHLKAINSKSITAAITDSSVISKAGSSKEIANQNIRHHNALLSVLQEVMNPPPPDARDQMGNWGLWNFEGKGPEAGPPDFAVGQVGAVMALPGCADQTIHADTPHLYVHTQLPGHYVNLFLPAVTTGSKSSMKEVGQTAFVLDSHQLRISAHVMNEEGGQQILEQLLVRPHLQAGDALLFDCRILHFGLANQHSNLPTSDGPRINNINSENDSSSGESNSQIDYSTDINISNSRESVSSEGWRPLLYVNYHQKFFQDPKNWNDKEKLFT
jgi:hypothetical protein